MEAAACFEKAMTLAPRQAAKLWELRATVSLSRLYVRQRRAAEAQTLLASVIEWFADEPRTVDLAEAHALWAELGVNC